MAAGRQTAGMDATDRHRAGLYRLLAALLSRPPTADLLGWVAGLRGDASPLGLTLTALGTAAADTGLAGVEKEYNRLFIGVERGELVPYASYYLSGFLMDRPLVKLRADMARLGIARDPSTREPEDHIAALLEMMAGLIDGDFGAPASLGEQHRFFAQHLSGWAARFFADLERAGSAVFYRPVGALGGLFMNIEESAFALDVQPAE